MGRLKDWNDRQRAAARERMAGNEATMRGQLPTRTTPAPQQHEADVAEPTDPRAWVKANKRHRIAELAGVNVFADRIIRLNTWPLPGGDVQPVAGVEATVDLSGGVSGRATLTRTAIPGAHGWQKKVDTRETWLVVDGPDFQWTVQVPQVLASKARGFAAAITTAGRRAAAG